MIFFYISAIKKNQSPFKDSGEPKQTSMSCFNQAF